MPARWWILHMPIVASLALSGCSEGEQHGTTPLQPIGLYTSLPILWRETGNLSGLLGSERRQHWALDVLGKYGSLRPLDDLSGNGGGLPLPPGALLVLAQPRPLSPDENVALDNWVRSGGRVLLFADPMLTAESRFTLGDSRRPQDIVLLSPILARWGLELHFDDAQPAGEFEAIVSGQVMPVNLPGRYSIAPDSEACAMLGSGLAVRCRIAEGEILALADAALLEDASGDSLSVRQVAFEALLISLEIREEAGWKPDSR